MIKKLFTLLTLALLVTPLTWGKDFYLTGTFNNWAMADGAYKFTESAGDGYTIYTLTVTNLGACNFKISDGSKKYGVYNADGVVLRTNCGPFATHWDDYSSDFVLNSAGTTTFTFKYTDGDPYQLEVYREPKLYIDGDITNGLELMTSISTGWTITKTFSLTDPKQKFHFVDEFGQKYGGNGWWVDAHIDNDEIPISANESDFVIDVNGDYIINVNSAISGCRIYSNNSAEEKSLAQLESNGGGVVGKPYTISNNLQLVAVSTKNNRTVVFARDLAFNDQNEEINTSISAVECPSLSNQGGANEPIDFMRKLATGDDKQVGPWKQNNWVMLDFTGGLPNNLNLNNNINIIEGGTLKGVYADNKNYTIVVNNGTSLTCVAGPEYTPNVYSPANFYVENGNHIQTINNKNYWFMTPKPMEFCKFTWAMYYKDEPNYPEGFYMQNQVGDGAPLKGGVGIEMKYNSGSPELANGKSYRFTGVIMNAASGAKDYYPQSADFNSDFKVAATNLGSEGSEVITAVNEVKTGSEVVSVTYCDLAGRMSQKPFAGVNIIVTRYSDGTVKTTKAIK